MTTEQTSKPQARSARFSPTPIILIHGLWGSGEQWKHWHDKFPGHEIVALDLRGHGSNPGNLNGMSLSIHVDDVIAEIERRGGRGILIGHSAGGLVAQLVAVRRPDLVERLVLLASSAPRSSGARLPTKKVFFKWWVMLALVTGRAFRLRKDAEELVAGSAHVKLGPESGLALLQLLMYRFDVRTVSCPVTVIAAEEDFFMPVSFQTRIANHYYVKPVIVPGGHMFHCDHRYQKRVIETVQDVICGGFEDTIATYPETRTAPAIRPAWST